MAHKNFRDILVHELIIHLQEENVTASGISRGRPSPTVSQLSQLEVKHSQHWPAKGKQRWCCVCSPQKQTWSTLYFCRKCDVGLCIVNCFLPSIPYMILDIFGLADLALFLVFHLPIQITVLLNSLPFLGTVGSLMEIDKACRVAVEPLQFCF